LIRRFLYGHLVLFRSVRDRGLVSPGCPGGSGAPEGCSSAWFPAWLPGRAASRELPVVSRASAVHDPTALLPAPLGTRGWPVKQDHPAYPAPGTFQPGCGSCAPPLPPSDWLLPVYSPEGRCQGRASRVRWPGTL